MTLTDSAIRHSHLIADTEAARTKALRSATEADRVLDLLRHAIENGRTAAALDMMTTVERHMDTIINTLRVPTETH